MAECLLITSSKSLICSSTHVNFSCRGNSKYHYYGIRVKPDSPLNRLQEDMQYMALRQQPVQQKQRYTCNYACRHAALVGTQVTVFFSFFNTYWCEPCDFRFKPVQKFDGCSGDNYSGVGQQQPGAEEQTVIAQSQHHQQFLGQPTFFSFI